MLRPVVVLLSLLWAPLASAQIIFTPPAAPQPIDSYPSHYYLTPHQAQLLRVLSEPRCNVTIQVFNPAGDVRVFAAPSPWAMGAYVPQDVSIDPQTGEPLYFRKRDLLPLEPPVQEPPATQPRNQAAPPATAPAGEPAASDLRQGGEIVIIPYHPRPVRAAFDRTR